MRYNNTKAVPSNGAAFVVKNATLVAVLALTLSSCATREQVAKVEERVYRLEAGKTETQTSMNRLDSLAREANKGKTGDYARLTSQIQTMSDRIEELMNSVSDLEDRLKFVQSRQSYSNSSGGATSQTDDNTSSSDGVDCTQMYDDSFILVRQGEYESARAGFMDYLEFCKNSDLADNAQYWIAESYYSNQQYTEAIKEFKALNENYKKSEKRPTAYYKLGRCSEELGRIPDAISFYTAILTHYPSTNEAARAKDKLGELKGEAKNRGDN